MIIWYDDGQTIPANSKSHLPVTEWTKRQAKRSWIKENVFLESQTVWQEILYKRSFTEKCAMRQHLQQKRKFFSAAHQRNRAQPQYCISQCEYFKSTSLLKYFTDSNDRTSLNLWNQVTWRTQKSQLWQKSSIEMKKQHTTHWNWKHPCC